jgi:glycosyltransferase involved in cell wall biosynthesis
VEKNSKDLAEKTLTLLADEEKRKKMAKNGRAFARDRFSLQQTKKRTLQLYDSLLSN